MEFFFPTRVTVGRGCVRENAAKLAALGKRALVVTGRSSAEKCGALSDVAAALDAAGVGYEVYNKIEQNPLFTTCADGARQARSFGAEFIIGIGGGSPLDAAKAIARLAADPGAGEAEMYAKTPRKPGLPVVAVGTTAGTGSEVTQVAVITGSDGRKKSFRSDDAFPVLALGDPTYTEFMPEAVTRSTAVDALCHCVESYFNNSATPFSRVFALRGAKTLIELFREFPDGAKLSPEQRDTAYLASLFGGVAISVTGTCIPHQLGYFLTERHGIPHGAACAFWLPAFVGHCSAAAPELVSRFNAETGSSPAELTELVKSISPPPAVTVTEKELAELSPRWDGNSCLTKTPGGIDKAFLESLLKKTFLEA